MDGTIAQRVKKHRGNQNSQIPRIDNLTKDSYLLSIGDLLS